MNKTVLARFIPLTAVAATLVACGGNDAPQPTTSGVVTGSYFRHAKVCLDANGNGRCDSNESSTTTDDNGAFTLKGEGAVVAEIGTDAKRFDPATGTETAVTRALVFRAPRGATGVVSAITTELAALMDDNGGDLAAAKTTLATRLGVAADKLLADHNKETDPTAKAILQAEIDQDIARIAEAVEEAGAGGDVNKALRNRLALEKIKTVVVIYAENRGFDNLYGLFPGANGIPGVNPTAVGTVVPQKDIDGSVLPALPPVWGGVTAAGQSVGAAGQHRRHAQQALPHRRPGGFLQHRRRGAAVGEDA